MLSEVCERHKKRFMEAVIGEHEEILTEEIIRVDGKDYTIGHTKNYIMMGVEGSFEENTLIDGIVDGFLQNDIMLLKTQAE